jgi:hypothetical protein
MFFFPHCRKERLVNETKKIKGLKFFKFIYIYMYIYIYIYICTYFQHVILIYIFTCTKNKVILEVTLVPLKNDEAFKITT